MVALNLVVIVDDKLKARPSGADLCSGVYVLMSSTSVKIISVSEMVARYVSVIWSTH
jgi:hypothetical protein